ncbi:transcription factor E2F3-like [Melanotaenia boesemani]|uniref:transcription factor E2F3-like n=1 Tax=Melanotaenia boesemani TaxID=1250792 RepID=UPI001C03B92B|nr:transcription factor E2F3-like [Melanotaenia boesemani]
MVKCVVSGCPNRIVSYNRGVFNRPPRRFFNFPKDPDRVKVWLAALRETDRDSSEQLVICEEHFLPEDISKKGLISDAIPITPPFFDRPLSLMGSWGPEQWSTGDPNDGGEEDKGRAPNAPPSQKQGPGRGLENPPAGQSISDSQQQNKTPSTTTGLNAPLSLLTQGFLQLLLAAPDGSVDLRQAAASLQTPTRRVRNIVNVLDDIGLIHRESERRISWIGNTSICSFLWRNPLKFLTALEKLQLVEHELDRLIKSCSQQLLDLTDNVDNSALAYVRCEDIARLATQEQTVIIIKAPPETKLHIPEPKEDRIHLHLVAETSPITVLSFEVDSAGVPTSSPKARSSVVFTELKEGRVGARSARSDSCDLTEEDPDGGSKADSEAVEKKTDQTKTVGQTFTGQARCMPGQPTEMGPPLSVTNMPPFLQTCMQLSH